MIDKTVARVVILWLWLSARLPRPAAAFLSIPGGWVLRHALRRRAAIVDTNLRLCFPDWNDRQRAMCWRQHFRALAYSFYEIAVAWCMADNRKLPPCSFSGLEHLRAARRRGCGMLMVCGHFTTMEITGRYYGELEPSDMVYRPLRNQALEAFQRRCRKHYATHQILQQEPARILRSLHAGRAIWFAPDQDFGPRRSVFVDFFAHPAATLTATWRLVRASGAEVLTMQSVRRPDGSYHIAFGPPVPGREEASPATMLAEINRRIEANARACPAQYWWLHRRFKTRPPGLDDIYS